MTDQRGPRAKNWCFTLNNYSQADLDRLASPLANVEYLIFGKEVGASGTPHLQGTICFTKRMRLSQVKEVVGQAHFSITRHLSHSIDYCKKESDFHEFGIPPPDRGHGQGRRDDLEAFKESVKSGVRDLKVLRELHSIVCARHPRFVDSYLEDNKPAHSVVAYPLRPWQETLNQKLIHAPDARKIIFIVDITGNSGKSWFARYYCDLHSNAQIIVPGKKADMAYVAREDSRVFFFDCPRSKQGDFIQYDFLEELKNGYFFSPKYESKIKKLATPHVVVLMNERPADDKLSRDRYDVTLLT